jgi:hypothetical protein
MYAIYYKSLLTGDIVRVPGTFSRKTADLVIRALADKLLNRLYWLEPVA